VKLKLGIVKDGKNIFSIFSTKKENIEQIFKFSIVKQKMIAT